MLTVSANPPALCPWAGSLADLKGRWWVAHTKARHEKAFAWDLIANHIAYFLPLYERARVICGKRRRAFVPLFPSYVFLCGDGGDRHAALSTNRLCSVIEVADQAGMLKELGQLELAMAGKAELDPYPYAAIGERCRVAGGAFRGVEGVVIRRNGVTKIVLAVSILAQGAEMKIDAGLLEPIR